MAYFREGTMDADPLWFSVDWCRRHRVVARWMDDGRLRLSVVDERDEVVTVYRSDEDAREAFIEGVLELEGVLMADELRRGIHAVTDDDC